MCWDKIIKCKFHLEKIDIYIEMLSMWIIYSSRIGLLSTFMCLTQQKWKYSGMIISPRSLNSIIICLIQEEAST